MEILQLVGDKMTPKPNGFLTTNTMQVYATEAIQHVTIPHAEIHILFSPSQVSRAIDIGLLDIANEPDFVCIGKSTMNRLQIYGLSGYIASEPTPSGILEAIRQCKV